MCANILSNAPDVELQGEIDGSAAPQMLAWLEAAHAATPSDEPHRIYRLARATFREGSAGRPKDRPDARWFGYKSPRHERYFTRYEALFADPARRARYVYCLRNPFHVWRSYRAMPWNQFRDVETFLKAWLRSVRTFEVMADAAPGRVRLFNLDSMIRAQDRLNWLTPVLLEPLEISAQTFRKPVENLGNSNSALNKVGAPPEEPPASDLGVIAAHPEVARLIQAHFPWMEEDMERFQRSAPRRGLFGVFGR